MSEDVVLDKIEPILKNLNERIGRLEKSIRVDVDKVEISPERSPQRRWAQLFSSALVWDYS